ncbi:MAG TPA: cytochrome P450 [Acidimicrobiales bacterium]|nr:cytochrome P450 [Acidimicrobiales bacterium]
MPDAPEFAFNVFDPAVKADPYPLYEEMRRTGRIIANPFLAGQFMVPGYDDVCTLLSDPATFANGQLTGGNAAGMLAAPTMLNTDPPDHERLRGPVARAFTPRSVNALAPRMAGVARDLLAPLADGAEFDVVADLAERLPVLVIAEMLGVGTDDLADFVAWSHGLMGVLDMFAPPETLEHARDCSKQLHDYFAAEVARRRDQPGEDDLVGRLVAANSDGKLSESELLAACVLLLLGGNETTTKLITNAALALARNPAERARLVAEPELLPTAVDEVLRYDTAVQANGRVTTEAVAFAGVDLPKGALVVALLAAANRDPDKFDDPARFDVGRDPNPHLSFSRGIHHCLGASLARLEAHAAIGELLRAAPDYVLLEAEATLTYGPVFFFHSPTRLAIGRAG